MAQEITVQIKGSWKFFNTTHLYTDPKTFLFFFLLLMLPQFGIIYVMIFILFPGKQLNSYLFNKAFPPYHINYPASLCHQLSYVYQFAITELDLMFCQRVFSYQFDLLTCDQPYQPNFLLRYSFSVKILLLIIHLIIPSSNKLPTTNRKYMTALPEHGLHPRNQARQRQ